MNSFSKGIITDIAPKLQSKDSYRFAMNAVLESREGDKGAITNELGTLFSVELPGELIGHCQLDDDTLALFLDNSEIGIYDPQSNSYTTLLQEDCLNFSTEYPVHCLFRIREGCKRTLYFTDRNNNYRTLTIEDIDSYYENGVFDCNQLELTPPYDIPQLEIARVLDNGGSLKVGSYQFAIRYLDEDLNPTNWLFVTSPVTVYDESQSTNYFSINGAIPVFDNAEAEEGAVPDTTKSLDLQIDNLDTSYTYFQIAALHSNSTVGRVSEVWILNEIYIGGTSTTFNYGGANTSLGHFQGDLSDIITDNTPIEVVQHHAQKDNYLILAGFQSKQYDYASFQEAAASITINWTSDKIPFENQFEDGDPKNPLTQYKYRSLMGDEVYAISVQYLINNKYWTPAFHIPGRVATAFDRNLITSNEDTNHLPDQASYERWQVENTASSDGTMGYFESSVSYPDIRNCAGNRVFPDGPIRHHRMPDRSLVPVYDSSGISILGISASNITFPHPDVTGYRILISVRDESNSTAIESALLTRAYLNLGTTTSTSDDQYEQPFFWGDPQWEPRTNTKAAILFSPQFYVDNNPSNFSYLKINNNINSSRNNTGPFEGLNFDRAGGGTFDISTRVSEFLSTPTSSTVFNRNVLTSIKVNPRTEQQVIGSFDNPIFNNSYSNPQHFVWMEDELGEEGYKIVTKKKVISNLYSNLSSIIYRPLNHNVQTESTFTSFNGDVYISELQIADIWSLRDQSSSRRRIDTHFLNRVWLESPINFGMIHPGTDICNSRYIQGNAFGDYFIYKIAEEQDNGEFAERTTPCLEFYGYNRDYSKINLEDIFFGLPLNFDYCSECINKYPYQIRYSKQSFQEEITDNYRVFLPNDYRNLDGSTGVINSLIIDKDELYALTDKAPWFVPTRPQQIVTNESIAYLGTGERLAIPPKKIASTYYGGCKDTKSICSTEFGTVYVSEREGKIFHLSSKLDELSNVNRNWFETNLPLSLSKAFREELSIEYPLRDAITNVNGIGFYTIYDPRYRRIIIHKKDYKPLYPLSVNHERNTLKYENGKFYYGDGRPPIEVDVTNTEYFENRSWTLSYSLADQAWVSFHSYLPQYIFNDDNQFYSTSNGIWTHNLGDYQTYYGIKYDWIVESIINPNPQASFVFQSIELVGNFQTWNSEYSYFTNDDNVFDRIVCFNDKQSTGLQTITQKNEDNPFVTNDTSVLMQKVDDEYQLSRIRNYVTNNGPVFTTTWSDISSDYFIDKIPNEDIIDYSKSQYESDRIRGEWMGVRLYSNTDSNTKITVELINNSSKYSYR